MKTVQLNVELGYQIKENKLLMSAEQARNLLLTRKQQNYTRALWCDDGVELTSNFIECPYCKNRVYAYSKHINKTFDKHLHPDDRLDKRTVIDWTTSQMTLFETSHKELALNRVISINADITCPKCKNTMHFSKQTRQVRIKHHRHKIEVRMEILDIKELLSLPCVSKQEITVKFPLFEVICFNFRNGHSYIRLENGDGECLAVRDFTFEKYKWTNDVVYSTIAKSKYVRRAIKNAFVDEWGNKIPFFSSELGINEFRLLTMFIGYKRSFYSCIPFENGTFEIDESFKVSACKMRYANNVIMLYEDSNLPKMKSVKKLFFDNTGLFFYINECERLWQILKNPDYFVGVLSEKDVYLLLSDLHIRPGMFDFLEDYATVGKLNNLFRLIHLHWNSVRKYAINYSSMSKFMRKSEHDRWRKHEFESAIGKLPNFAIPMCETGERIRNCTIDEFEFSWLVTSADYKEAGKALNNCLTDWKMHYHPVVCVRQNGKIIAALEIRKDFVFQAYTSNNESLSKIPGLFEAYIKWHEKNNLSQQYLPDDEDYYEPIDDLDDDWRLPF